jgi:hypothetical protein
MVGRPKRVLYRGTHCGYEWTHETKCGEQGVVNGHLQMMHDEHEGYGSACQAQFCHIIVKVR